MIKRYEITYAYDDFFYVDKDEQDGNYVLFEDHAREVEELERRVRWLESLFNDDYFCYAGFDQRNNCHRCSKCGVQKFPNLFGPLFSDATYERGKHLDTCETFLPDGTPKPTPEDFK